MLRDKHGSRSVQRVYPNLLALWDYTRNIKEPHEIYALSKEKVWWVCKEGHSSYCSVPRKSVDPGCKTCEVLSTWEESISCRYPEVFSQWNYRLNEVSPHDINANHASKLWWVCDKGHSQRCTIQERKEHGCPLCTSLHPDTLADWHTERNYHIDVSNLSSLSKDIVWWKCKYDHVWKSSVAMRSYGKGCRECNSARLLSLFRV